MTRKAHTNVIIFGKARSNSVVMSWKLVVGVTLLLLQDSQSAKILHTVDGHYDESWRAQNLTSLSALAELTAQSAVLVAYLDDTAGKDSCAFGTRDAPGPQITTLVVILLLRLWHSSSHMLLLHCIISYSNCLADTSFVSAPQLTSAECTQLVPVRQERAGI